MKSIIEILSFLSQIHDQKKHQDFEIKNISIDSRFKGDDWCFIADKASSINLNTYILSAIKNGAVFVLTDNKDVSEIDNIFNVPIVYIKDIKQQLPKIAAWFYATPSTTMNVLAVTGTNGKTSVSHLCAQLFSSLEQKVGVLGTIGNGCWPNLTESPLTTPDIVSMQRIMAKFNHLQTDTVILEASSHGIEQGRIDGIMVNIAIWTNLSHDHLDYHKSMENYFQAKADLFKLSCLKFAIINIDDKYGNRLINEHIIGEHVKLITYSLKNSQADLYIEIKRITARGYDLVLHFQQEVYQITPPLMGEFNLYNLGASLLAAHSCGITFKQLLRGVGNLNPIVGRMQKLIFLNQPIVIIDYAHTPDALENGLKTIRKHFSAKLWCVFGCGGDRDKSKRPKMAVIAEKYADEVILTEDNNRTESIYNIINDIEAGFITDRKHTIIQSRLKAIKFVLQRAKKEDVIFLAGKGHEHYIDKNNEKTYFNEKEIIEKFWRS